MKHKNRKINPRVTLGVFMTMGLCLFAAEAQAECEYQGRLYSPGARVCGQGTKGLSQHWVYRCDPGRPDFWQAIYEKC
jgi:hypothetical protein